MAYEGTIEGMKWESKYGGGKYFLDVTFDESIPDAVRFEEGCKLACTRGMYVDIRTKAKYLSTKYPAWTEGFDKIVIAPNQTLDSLLAEHPAK